MVGGFESKLTINSVGVRGCEFGPESDDGSDHYDSEDSSTLTLYDRACTMPPLYA